jgi:hypothetical protein
MVPDVEDQRLIRQLVEAMSTLAMPPDKQLAHLQSEGRELSIDELALDSMTSLERSSATHSCSRPPNVTRLPISTRSLMR